MAHRNPTAFTSFVYRQMTSTIPVPHQSFAGQTIIITGANTGLGFEAAKHIVRLGAEKVILGVRTLSKGEEAKVEIESTSGKVGVVEVWQVDLASYNSVKAFVKKAESLQRIDVVLENAGVLTEKFTMTEDNETSLSVNVVSTFLLALMVLPKLRESAAKFDIIPRISIVSSLVHHYTNLSAKSYPKIFQSMNHSEQANMRTRYMDSKLLQILYCQHLAPAMADSGKPRVTLNLLDPGYCHSGIFSENEHAGIRISKKFLARSTEEGSRTLVAAVVAGNEDTHGKYMSDAKIASTSKFVRSGEGEQVARRVWDELNEKLETIEPGVLANI